MNACMYAVCKEKVVNNLSWFSYIFLGGSSKLFLEKLASL